MRFVQSALMLDAVSWSNRLLSCVWVCCMEPESRVCGSGRDGAVVWCEGQTTGCHFHIGFAVCGWGSNPRSPRLYCKLQEWPSQNMGEEGVKRPDTLYVYKFRHVRWSLGPELCRHPVQASHIAVSVNLTVAALVEPASAICQFEICVLLWKILPLSDINRINVLHDYNVKEILAITSLWNHVYLDGAF